MARIVMALDGHEEAPRARLRSIIVEYLDRREDAIRVRAENP
jgi:hypothetical protein